MDAEFQQRQACLEKNQTFKAAANYIVAAAKTNRQYPARIPWTCNTYEKEFAGVGHLKHVVSRQEPIEDEESVVDNYEVDSVVRNFGKGKSDSSKPFKIEQMQSDATKDNTDKKLPEHVVGRPVFQVPLYNQVPENSCSDNVSVQVVSHSESHDFLLDIQQLDSDRGFPSKYQHSLVSPSEVTPVSEMVDESQDDDLELDFRRAYCEPYNSFYKRAQSETVYGPDTAVQKPSRVHQKKVHGIGHLQYDKTPMVDFPVFVWPPVEYEPQT